MKRTLVLALGCLVVFLLAALFRYQQPDRLETAGSGLEGQPSAVSASRTGPAKGTPAGPDADLQAAAEPSTGKLPEPTPETAPAPGGADLDKVVQHEIAEVFAEEALRTFPLHTARAFDPLSADPYGPSPGELWIRIKADNSREMKHIMDQVANLYRDVSGTAEPVTVIHWVGNRPFAKFDYGADK